MCYDLTYSGDETNLCYEGIDIGQALNCDYSIFTNFSQDCAYVYNSNMIKDCFGCVGLWQKQYCILNRQLTKTKYQKLRAEIMTDLKRKRLGWWNLAV
jgi:hypothetical protein